MQGQFQEGQRWVSTTEPELGLGVLLEVDGGKVVIFFAAADQKKTYAVAIAPLLRVRFKEGDQILIRGRDVTAVQSVREEDGLLYYECAEGVFKETELDDTISFSKPEDRLLGGHVDELRTFQLRIESLYRSQRIKRSPVRGFLGGRVDLIAHQIAIVKEVCGRAAPRVLLADEVGLGKTIEACLVMHHLHLSGRADRVLILVPESLVHQWFVELLRRFNMGFTIFDEQRDQSVKDENPFLESQLILCAQEFFEACPERVQEAIDARFDLLIVDEAHHLDWSPDEMSEGYRFVERLSAVTSSVLLLTATPQQLGVEGHFARLRLLDGHRYNDLQHFVAESSYYEEVANAIDVIREGGIPQVKVFEERSPRIAQGILNIEQPGGRSALIRDLLDSFGTGRVMFRNTRKELSGFPQRQVHLVKLSGEDELSAKLDWLVEFLLKRKGQKALLICKTIQWVEQISEGLLERLSIKMALFHEELTLLQRDRNAAYFSESDGAQILLCSEIGSEGRNFQFAHHLVLFDLPENPELLEQRIGRLDRIGQSEAIQIHVPYLEGSRGERYARWYQEGLNSFESNLHGAHLVVKRLQKIQADSLEKFIEESKRLRIEIEGQMQRGVDRLLSMTSKGFDDLDETLKLLAQWDGDRSFEGWVVRLFDFFGISVEDLGERSYFLNPENVITDAFPDLPRDGLGVTFDRKKALSREELGLMTADHPMVRSSIDLLLSGEAGNSAFGVWESAGPKLIILEAYYLVECVAPASLQTDRYLPATPVRVAIDHQGNDLTQDQALLKATLREGDHRKILEQPKITGEIIPKMIKVLERLAGQKKVEFIKDARKKNADDSYQELSRLKDLQQLNPLIDADEISSHERREGLIQEALLGARLRLDSLRLIYRTPPR